VQLEEAENGATRVSLESDVALGGMLGSVGQKVVAKQASVVTKSFAQALEQELSGGGGELGEPAVVADAEPPPPGAAPDSVSEAGALPSGFAPGPAQERSAMPPRLVAAGGGVLIFLLILRWVRSR
jgi:hypothetical protein